MPEKRYRDGAEVLYAGQGDNHQSHGWQSENRL